MLQVWLAALLTLSGVGCLELGGGALSGVEAGDAWAVVQAIGFGASFYLIGRCLPETTHCLPEEAGAAEGADTDGGGESQVLPLTAVNVACVALFAAGWAAVDGCALGPFAAHSASSGWLLDESTRAAYALPGALISSPATGAALLWTGLLTTALVRGGGSKEGGGGLPLAIGGCLP